MFLKWLNWTVPDFKIKKGKKNTPSSCKDFADGVIATSELPNWVKPANATNYARMHSSVSSSRLKKLRSCSWSSRLTSAQAELKSDSLKAFHKQSSSCSRWHLRTTNWNNIEISAYASPDGGVELNTTLAENRQNNKKKIHEPAVKER